MVDLIKIASKELEKKHLKGRYDKKRLIFI